ncbi:MAG: chloride channel protein [Eubacterium sp.]|nr:chloride channel protein [Eubacterium sp.]
MFSFKDFNPVQKKNEAAVLIDSTKNLKYKLALEGVAVGIVSGLIAVVYRFALTYSEQELRLVLTQAKGNPGAMALWFLLLIFMALTVGFLIRWEPMISGSGIPQVEGELEGHFETNWLKVLVGKLVGGVLCILGGLSLGREGPSVQLGAMGGKGFSKIFKRLNVEERYLMTCGASAGLAAAFNAPLAGVMFSLEEVHKSFSVSVLFCAMTASVTADFISKLFFGMSTVFNFPVSAGIPLKAYGWIVLLGVVLGICGALYNRALSLSQGFYGKMKRLPAVLKPVIPFVAAGILGFTLPEVLGGGHAMITDLQDGRLALGAMALLLAAKFLFSMLSFGSGAPGGIFFPLLVLGAYIGGIFGKLAIGTGTIEAQYLNNFIILAMAGYFTAIVRAPITGIVLITEMTGSLDHLLSLSVVAIVAEITAAGLGAEPVYEMLLDKLLARRGAKPVEAAGDKTLLTVAVQQGSLAAETQIADLSWPEACLLVSIRRGDKEIIPRGDTLILPADTLVALTDEARFVPVSRGLHQLCDDSSDWGKGEV